MPTEFTFGQVVAVGGVSGGTSVPFPMTVTAVTDDGSIETGDEVFFSDVNSVVTSVTGIDDGDVVFYLGSAIINGQKAYVFSNVATLTPGSPLVFTFDTANVSVRASDLTSFATGEELLLLEDTPACFLEGTLIETVNGPMRVERIEEGDLLVTADGYATRVVWVGVQEMLPIFLLKEAANPIRIAKNALAPAVPTRDLYVSPDHGIFIEGVLCNAVTLINGTTIRQVNQVPNHGIRYYNIETKAHELIMAEGCPVETFIDYVDRAKFDNFSEYKTRFGSERVIEEMPGFRVTSRRVLPLAIKMRLGIGAMEEQVE